MDHVTPEQLFFGLGTAVLIALVGMVVIGVWPVLWPWLKEMGHKIWFTVSHPFAWTIRIDMSSGELEEDDDEVVSANENDVKQTVKNGEIVISSTETQGFTFPDGFTFLARLVIANELTETKALKIACKVNPGKDPKYTAARDALHAAMDKERPPQGPQFRPLTADSKPVLKETEV